MEKICLKSGLMTIIEWKDLNIDETTVTWLAKKLKPSVKNLFHRMLQLSTEEAVTIQHVLSYYTDLFFTREFAENALNYGYNILAAYFRQRTEHSNLPRWGPRSALQRRRVSNRRKWKVLRSCGCFLRQQRKEHT